MPDNMIGKRIGNYEIISEIGRGGMGIVFKAKQISLGRIVAIKILPWGMESDPENLQRFQREALSAAQLSHPNIVTIFDISSDGTVHYIAMEFVEGKELADVISERGKLGTRESLMIARQVAGALAAAHTLNVIHRDIKPRNIMLDASGRAKVMDFGIAKLTSANTNITRAGAILGTPEFMSPEQIQGQDIDLRTDIYAVGVVLWQMLTGKVPYQAVTPLGVLRMIVDSPLPSIRDFKPRLPDSVVSLLEKALAKDRNDRFSTAQEMEEEIARILNSGEIVDDEAEVSKGSTSGTGPKANSHKITSVYGPAFSTSDATSDKPAHSRRKAVAVFLFAAIVVVGGAAVVMFKKGGSDAKPHEKIVASSPPSSPQGAPAAIPAVKEPVAATPQASPTTLAAPVLPLLRWKDAPAEGAEVKEGKVTLGWEVANDTLASGFLVGLNDPNPKLIVREMSKSFDLTTEGEQVVVVIPLNENNVKGAELRRTFVHKAAVPPTISGALVLSSIPAGQPGKFNLTVTDPRREQVTTEARLNGGEWTTLASAERAIAALTPGNHTAEARATNASGLKSDIWSSSFEVKKLETPTPRASPTPTPRASASPTPRASPSPVATPTPVNVASARGAATSATPPAAAPAGSSAKPAAGKVVSSAGGNFESVAEAISKSPAGAKLTLAPGRYNEAIVIDKNIEIVGGGPREEVIIQSSSEACVTIKAGTATLRGLTFRATANRGGFSLPRSGDAMQPRQGVFSGEFAGTLHAIGGEATLEDCSLESAFFQAVLVERGANPVLRKCVIKGKGAASAVTFAEGAKGTLQDCDITGGFLWGVDVRSGAAPILTHCRIHAFGLDGVYFDANAGGTLDDCDVFDNESHGVTLGRESSAQLRSSRITRNGMEGINAPGEAGGSVENCDLTRNGGLGAYKLSMGAKRTLKLAGNKDE